MRDNTDNSARSHFRPQGPRLPRRQPGAALEAEVGHPVPPVGTLPLNERVYWQVTDPAGPFRPSSRAGVRTVAPPSEEDPGYVIHLPVRVGDVEAATRLAYTVAGSLAFLVEVDPGETTVSTVDDQNNRIRVFCDLLLPDRSRCSRRYAHDGPCGQPDPDAENGAVALPRPRP
ncbi:hypothetical protein [Micromonospora zhanjiangensis]|uniref:Uncharacterized protein n=1 Tax=Micromonospora zhanjiangensis TaxID=1522057 RepID=A0ABV8KUI6_9ACTN